MSTDRTSEPDPTITAAAAPLPGLAGFLLSGARRGADLVRCKVPAGVLTTDEPEALAAADVPPGEEPRPL